MTELKLIAPKDVPQTIDMAAQCRLRGDDVVAESMCMDVLSQEPENQIALEVLLRIFADRIAVGDKSALADARHVLPKLGDPGTHAFCNALIYEAQARRLTSRSDLPAAAAAQELFSFAVEQFEQAADAAKDPLESHLRANACLRAMSMISAVGLPYDDPQEHAIE